MYVQQTPKRFVAFGDNLPDMQAWLANVAPEWPERRSITSAAEYTWDLGAGYNGAAALARDGWSEGAKGIEDVLIAADVRNEHTATYVWDVAGYEPDVGRFVAGDPACMRHRRKVADHGKEPIVEIIYNITASANIKAESLRLMGAAMLAVIDQLESHGRRVELSVAFCTTVRGNHVVSGWKVKEATDPPDLAAIAFSVAHPAAMRRLCFAACERSPYGWCEPGYGRATSVKATDIPGASEAAFAIDGLSGFFAGPRTLAQAVAIISEQVNAAAGFELVTAV